MWPVGDFGFRRAQHTSSDWSPAIELFSSWVSTNGLSTIKVIAAPPPRLFSLGVDIYWIPWSSNASSMVLVCAAFSLSSHISLWSPSCISFSKISSIRLLNFGKIDLWLATMILGRERAVTARLSLLMVFRYGVRGCRVMGGRGLGLTMTGIGCGIESWKLVILVLVLLVVRSLLGTWVQVGVVIVGAVNGRKLSRSDQLWNDGDDELLSSENNCPGTIRSGVSSGSVN